MMLSILGSLRYSNKLLPLADIVTPNLKEASALLGGCSLKSVADMYSAAKLIHSLGPRYVNVDIFNAHSIKIVHWITTFSLSLSISFVNGSL